MPDTPAGSLVRWQMRDPMRGKRPAETHHRPVRGTQGSSSGGNGGRRSWRQETRACQKGTHRRAVDSRSERLGKSDVTEKLKSPSTPGEGGSALVRRPAWSEVFICNTACAAGRALRSASSWQFQLGRSGLADLTNHDRALGERDCTKTLTQARASAEPRGAGRRIPATHGGCLVREHRLGQRLGSHARGREVPLQLRTKRPRTGKGKRRAYEHA